MKHKSSIRSFEGLGTSWKILIAESMPADTITDIFNSVEALTRKFEKQYSRFDSSSLIGKLNKTGQLTDYPSELYDMLEYAVLCANVTDGYFNIAVGGRLDDIGYDPDYSFRSKDRLESIPDIRTVLHLSEGCIRLDSNAKIDLGGFGKGWMIDKIANHFLAKGVQTFAIDGGGDLRVEGDALKGQRIPLDSPFKNGQSIGEIRFHRGSVAGSSPKYRQWPKLGTDITLHHLINPKNKSTITNIAAVYTHAETALSSDTASTCFFVSPPVLHKKIAEHFGVSYCIIFPDGGFYLSTDYPGKIFSKN